MSFAVAALALSGVAWSQLTTTTTPTPPFTTMPSKYPLVNPDPTPEQRAALGAVYDALRCRADVCVRVGDVTEVCGFQSTALCNNSRVEELYIEGAFKLEGTLGAELLALTGLTAITVANAMLAGTLSTYLGALTGLLWLDLRSNLFSGTIPTELGLLTKLEHLNLAFNQLEGPIPASLTRLTKLLYLAVSHNKLSGVVPPLSFVQECYVAAIPDMRFASDGNCFDNCDNETLCCEGSMWPCGEAVESSDGGDNVALIVGVVLGILLAIAMAVVVVVVVRNSRTTSTNKADEIEVRINNSGYAAASEMADNGLPPSQQLQVSRKYSNPLDSADSPYNVMPGSPDPSSPLGGDAYMQWGAVSPMARPMPAPPGGGAHNNNNNHNNNPHLMRSATVVDANVEYRNIHNNQTNFGQQSIPMPGSSGGLAQPYVPNGFIDQQQQHQYNDDRFANTRSPW